MVNGESVSALHHQFQIRRSVLYRWRDAYRKQGAAGLRSAGRPPGVASPRSGISPEEAAARQQFASSNSPSSHLIPPQPLSPDIPPVMHPHKFDLPYRFVRPLDRAPQILARRGHTSTRPPAVSRPRAPTRVPA